MQWTRSAIAKIATNSTIDVTNWNVVLAFAGMRIREDGKLEPVPAAATLSEAQQRANKLRSELMRRGIAGDVLRFCRPELLEGNYFHAAFEATKSVAQKLRDRTGLVLDGHALVETDSLDQEWPYANARLERPDK